MMHDGVVQPERPHHDARRVCPLGANGSEYKKCALSMRRRSAFGVPVRIHAISMEFASLPEVVV